MPRRKKSKLSSELLESDSISTKRIKVMETNTHKKKSKSQNDTQIMFGNEKRKSERKTRLSAKKTRNDDEPKTKKAKIVLKSEADENIIQEQVINLISHESKNDGVVEKSSYFDSPQHIEPKLDNENSSSESEWEEVEDRTEEQILEDYKPNIPEEGVEITIDCPGLNVRKKKRKEFDAMDYIRLHINRGRKEIQLNIHKTHLLCLLAQGFYINNFLNSPIIKGLGISLLIDDIKSLTGVKKTDQVNVGGIEKLLKWYRSSFAFENIRTPFVNMSTNFFQCFETRSASNATEYNLLFVALLRIFGLKVRFCMSFYPVSYKAQNLIKKNPTTKQSDEKISTEVKDEPSTSTITKKKRITNKTENKEVVENKKERKGPKKNNLMKPRKENTKKEKGEKRNTRPSRASSVSYKMDSGESDDNDKDNDFVPSNDEYDDDFQNRPRLRIPQSSQGAKKNRKILSSDSAPSSPEISSMETDKIICWAEIFSKPDKQWVSVDSANNICDKPYEIESMLPQPVTYILTYDSTGHVKDVTRRYCSEYMTSTIKLRVDCDWWEETLLPFLPAETKLDKEEEAKLEKLLIDQPLPKTVSGFKNHPLYALKRHLLKFEAIYPPDATTVGFFRNEPVYPRECVAQLHSRETWLKEARVVKVGEQAYKVVKARPKWDKMAGVMRTDLPLDVFGFWQTKPYEPPIAVDGKVPRNEYGNVELFKACMLPVGTVHLQISGLNRVARKLGIDCSPAVVGFDGHKGSIHPVFDGFVICEEFKDTILAAWDEEQENARKREEEKSVSMAIGRNL